MYRVQILTENPLSWRNESEGLDMIMVNNLTDVLLSFEKERQLFKKKILLPNSTVRL